MRTFRFAIAFSLLALACQSATAQSLPVARRVDVVDTAFGMKIADPYRWMEGENNAEHDAWLKAYGEATRHRLDALPGLASWIQRIDAVAGDMDTLLPEERATAPMLLTRVKAGRQKELIERDAQGRDHIVFDPNAEPGTTMGETPVVSPDRSMVAVNVGRKGNESGTIEIREMKTGRLLESLSPVWSELTASWLPNGKQLTYTRLREAQPDDPNPLDRMGIYLHTIGEPQARDRLLIQTGDPKASLKISGDSFSRVTAYTGSGWVRLSEGHAFPAHRICVAPLASLSTPHVPWNCLVDFSDDIQSSLIHGSTLYMLQAGPFSNRRVLALDLDQPSPSLAKAREIIPERADLVLNDFDAASDGLYISAMRNGLGKVERFDFHTGRTFPIELPVQGTAKVVADATQPGVAIILSGWTAPQHAWRYDAASGRLIDMKMGRESTIDFSSVMSEEVEVTSADGTRVPMSIMRPKTPRGPGQTVAIVDAYGGYGFVAQPTFLTGRLAWAKAGNIYADCDVRGGGEKGNAWWLAGKGANKQRGVEDFIACGKALQSMGLATRARTIGMGTSMGGVLGGGAYTTPGQDGIGGMILNVAFLNAARLAEMKNGSNQIPEVGDPATEAGYRQLLAMDPYQRMDAAKPAIPLLLMVGLVDQRVAPWNSSKFAAKLMHNFPATPVWIRTDGAKGHFATSAKDGVAMRADIFAAAEAMANGQFTPLDVK